MHRFIPSLSLNAVRFDDNCLRWLALCLVLMVVSVNAFAADLSARVDRTQLAANESLTLTLTYKGQTMDSPDFSGLEKDFEVLSSQRQSQLSLGFGNNTSSTDWVITLMPKRAGQLVIPSFHFKGEVSDALAITISKAKPSSDSSQAIFIETELEKDTAYVQSQVLLTLRLNTSVMLSSVDIPELTISDARVMRIHDAQYQKTINGREYMVVEMKYAIFPEKTGTLEIPAQRISGMMPDRNDPFGGRSLFTGRGQPVRLESEAKSLRVLPVPAQHTAIPWIPAKGLSISQRWSSKPDALTVGEPITRSITVTAQGLPGAQLPPLAIDEGRGFKYYPDQPDISETLSPSGVLGTRTESWAIVPTDAGTLTLPAVKVRWWDIQAGEMRETLLEAMTLTVAPAAASNDTSPAQTAPASENHAPDSESPPAGFTGNPLLYGSLFMNGVLLMALLGLVLVLVRKPKITVAQRPQGEAAAFSETEKAAFRAILKADTSRLAELRAGILRWGQLYWPDRKITTLADIVRISGAQELQALFASMDNSLYGESPVDAVDVKAIIAGLKAIRSHGSTAEHRESALAPLYPQATD